MALPDKQTYSALGGDIQDYQAVEDPTTDLSDEQSNETRADVAAMTRMIPRAMVSFTTNGATCTVVDHEAVWGNALSVKPVVTVDPVYGATLIVVWPTTVMDARGVTYALNLKRGLGNVGEFGFMSAVQMISANSLRITPGSVVDSSNGFPGDHNSVITVWVW